MAEVETQRLCKKCGSPSFRLEQVTFKNGSEHLKRICNQCEAFNDYAAKEIPPGMFLLPFGKYKGKPLDWIVFNDRGYAEWLWNNLKSKTIVARLEEVFADHGMILAVLANAEEKKNSKPYVNKRNKVQ